MVIRPPWRSRVYQGEKRGPRIAGMVQDAERVGKIEGVPRQRRGQQIALDIAQVRHADALGRRPAHAGGQVDADEADAGMLAGQGQGAAAAAAAGIDAGLSLGQAAA